MRCEQAAAMRVQRMSRAADRLLPEASLALPVDDAGRAASHAGLAASALTIEIERGSDAFHRLKAEWNALHQKSTRRNPFLTHAWTRACWFNREREASLYLCTARSRGELVAIAPLCVERWHGLRTLRFLADGRSDYLGFLCRNDDAVIERWLLAELLARPGEWDLVLLGRLAEDYSALPTATLPDCLRWVRTRAASAPFCAWNGDWESLHKDGPSWFREMRKRRRRYFKDGGTAACLTGADAVTRLESIAAIERRSWKGRNRSTRLQRGPGQNILRHALGTLGRRGEMQLWLAECEGQAIAFQIDFVLPDRLLHYQCAFDARFAAMRAGSVLAYLSLEQGWARGVREFDYLTGDEPYKRQRTNATRSICALAGYRPGLRGWIAYWILVGARSRLRRIKALRTLRAGLASLRRRPRSRAET